MEKNRILLFVLFIAPAALFAQDDLNNLLKGSAADAKIISEGYISPFMKAFGYGLNQGWYNSAAPHKFPGFDLTVSVAMPSIPSADKLFEIDNTKLTTVSLIEDHKGTPVSGTGKASIPTIFGPSTAPRFQFDNPPNDQFDGLAGVDLKDKFGINFLPVPIVHLGIGLPKGFDLKVRYVPSIDLGDGSFDLIGFGVLHDVKQYIPGIKALPFDLAGFVGYTKMKLDVGFDTPSHRGEFSSSATTIQALISKKVAVLTGYAGIGYNIAKTKLGVKGAYDLNADGDSTDAGETNPVSIEVASSGPRATIGLRLKLAVIAFHADYTLQKYNALTVGFGINVR